MIAKFVFEGLAALVFITLFFRNRSLGEESPTKQETDRTTINFIKIIERTLLIGATGFVVIQLVRICLK